VPEEIGTWHDTVRKVPGEARAELVEEDHPEGRSAILRYQVRQVFSDVSWLEIQLETGRTHQIRVQASHRGHPILGDFQYGATAPFGPTASGPRDRWIALHSRMICFHHPTTRERIRVTAAVPQYWEDLLGNST
jgi:23S rRNA-/tRNA-specific pseudouridylate synthase